MILDEPKIIVIDGRHQDIEDPDHAKALIAQRGHAREQRLMLRFLAPAPEGACF